MATTRRKGVRKVSKNIPQGIAYIKASFNNTIVSVADRRGNVISWCSAGKLKYSGARKSTAFVATRIASEAAAVAMQNGMREVEVKVSGPGAGREAAVRAFETAGMTVTSISDTTPVPHNGCRPRKRRRV
ncbi:30S ribosomal protein S11 [bacterium]|nr:30S ribosomal protein S11 [bacterium]MBP5627545.1 30S ribosomal protein S11 [bacterium]MBR5946958.1 30S ribosomal protein S11 [bacterium]MBR6462325.1 30S ribosomal protein S11 [bacterium]